MKEKERKPSGQIVGNHCVCKGGMKEKFIRHPGWQV
jgi:hypothetical protein